MISGLKTRIRSFDVALSEEIAHIHQLEQERDDWKERAQRWEADAKEVAKLRKRLASKAKAEASAPERRKALGLPGRADW
jgi:hypothetical protein